MTGVDIEGVNFGEIERELGKLRYMAAGEPARGEVIALRSSLLNMVVYSEDDEDAELAGRLIGNLASNHPSRALVVVARPSAADSTIETRLAAHCHLTSNREQCVCCEEVTLHVSGRAASHLHSLIAALLIPDLPVYVWWTEPVPEAGHELEELLQVADRLIVDSEAFSDQLVELLRLARFAAKEPATGIGDLSWGRLTAWRQMLQQQRQIAEMRHHLSSVESVEMQYSARNGKRYPAQALFFLAWLAGDLGWDVSEATRRGDDHLAFPHNGRKIDLSLQPVDYPDVDPGCLTSVRIACRSETAHAVLTISRAHDAQHVTIQSEHRGATTESHVVIPCTDTGGALAQELDLLPNDAQFGRVLSRAVPLMLAWSG